MPMLSRDQRHEVTVRLDGAMVSASVEPRRLLSDFLREQAEGRAVHVGCEHGVCGACTVRLDGRAVRACLTLAVQANGRTVDTAAGLASPDGTLSDLQQAFRRHHALQCGYCTTGILMSASDYLERNPRPDEAAVRDMLSGHLCRCTGYVGMVRAILDVAEERARD